MPTMSAPPRQGSPLNFLNDDDDASTGSRAQDEQGKDGRPAQERVEDRKLAERLSRLIEDANQKCTPLCKMIRKARCFSHHPSRFL